jgi:hypothetical protein
LTVRSKRREEYRRDKGVRKEKKTEETRKVPKRGGKGVREEN